MNKKGIILTFGRFNPPTIGHKKLFDVMLSNSYGKDHRVFVSQTQDIYKNPLFFKEKIALLKKMFPKMIFNEDTKVKTPFDMLEKVYKEGYKEVFFVVGQDRITQFKDSVNKQQGKLYEFEKIHFVSSGNRDPDNDDPTISMSASKARKLALDGDFVGFYNCLGKLSIEDAVDLMKLIRNRMINKELIS
jgi:hypothetical protein